MEKKAKAYNVIRLALLGLAAGVALGAVFLAMQWWWPAGYQPTAQAATTECVFVNHVRRGPGHPYRQEAGEKCRYEIEPRVAY